jgi:hypothetical protein
VSRANVTVTTATNDADIADIDPDWKHSWWTIRPTASIAEFVRFVTIDGFSQPGSRANSLAVGDDSLHRIEIDGVNSAAHGLQFNAGVTEGTSNTVRGPRARWTRLRPRCGN